MSAKRRLLAHSDTPRRPRPAESADHGHGDRAREAAVQPSTKGARRDDCGVSSSHRAAFGRHTDHEDSTWADVAATDLPGLKRRVIGARHLPLPYDGIEDTSFDLDEPSELLCRRMALLREMIGSFCLDPEPDEVEARSLLAFCVAIGHHSLAADHEGRTRAKVLVRAGDLILNRTRTRGQ